jgi:hypothetical protein
LRLTIYEHEALCHLVDDTNAKMRANGIPPNMSQVALVKWLISEEIKRRNLSEETVRRVQARLATLEGAETARWTAKDKQAEASPARIAAMQVDRVVKRHAKKPNP